MSAPRSEGGLSRRSLLQYAAAGGLAAGAAAALPKWTMPAARAQSGPKGGMNILFIMVDQLRSPYAFMGRGMQSLVCPSMTGLGDDGVRFTHYYTVSNDCTPARAAQATGLYTHQIGIFAMLAATRSSPPPQIGRMAAKRSGSRAARSHVP